MGNGQGNGQKAKQEEEYVTYLVSQVCCRINPGSEANLCGDCVLQCLLSRSVFVRDGACCLLCAKSGEASFAETNLHLQVDANIGIVQHQMETEFDSI
jgi:hypothetical protein